MDASREVPEELKAILETEPVLDSVVTDRFFNLPAEVTGVNAYINIDGIEYELIKNSSKLSGYRTYFLAHISLNVDCGEDPLAVYDVVDKVNKALLDDTKLWNVVTDRDILSVTFDNSQLLPYRAATILVKLVTDLNC